MKLWEERPDLEANSPEWWDEKGKRYDANGNGRDRPDEYQAAAKLMVSPVVEVGSALGALCNYLPANMHYLGIEISPYMTLRARKTHPKRAFINADAIEIAEEFMGAFSTVVALQVIEHFEEPLEFMSAARLMARDRLIFSVPRMGYHKGHLKNDGHVSWWGSEGEFRAFFEQFGKLTTWEGAKNHRCGIIEWQTSK